MLPEKYFTDGIIYKKYVTCPEGFAPAPEYKGKKRYFFTNEKDTVLRVSCPNGYYRGQSPERKLKEKNRKRPKRNQKSKKQWTNGIENVRKFKCPSGFWERVMPENRITHNKIKNPPQN